jgi:dihydrofolate reductase
MVWRGRASVAFMGIPVPRGGTVVCPTLFLRVTTAEKQESITRKIENMRKIILYMAASLDQRIAELDGSLDWLAGFPNPNKTDDTYRDLLASVDTVIMGGRTYREFQNMDVIWPYPKQMTYVISRYDWGAKENVHFITENIIETVSALLSGPGKDILLAGGGELTSLLLAADLIDEIQITYIPVILGKGIPLFPKQPKQPKQSKWKLVAAQTCIGNVLTIIYSKTE